jgi:hypothetical protein
MNIKLTLFYVWHRLTWISCCCKIGTITVDAICSLRELSESEDMHKDPYLKPKIDNRDWPKTMEAIDDYLGRVLGKENLPLAYVIHQEAWVPATADNPDTKYTTPNSEMIRRAPHCKNNAPSPTYIANNALVANELTKIFSDTSTWTYAKPFIRLSLLLDVATDAWLIMLFSIIILDQTMLIIRRQNAQHSHI